MVIKVPGPLNDKYPIWIQQCLKQWRWRRSVQWTLMHLLVPTY
jgi:hypothetical protein